MRIPICVIVLAACLPSTARAQTSTADGALALVQGDYATAIRILTPLTEQTTPPDQFAPFFLAMAYQSSPGFDNKMAACRLFLRAADSAGPFADAARSMAAQFHGSARVAQPCPGTTPPPAAPRSDATMPSAAPHAETPTAQGVAAFVRGDYERAAAILKPLAERTTLPGDAIAQFFMAAMYNDGRGVASDSMRACALYLRAGGPIPPPGPSTVFAKTASMMPFLLQQSMDKERFAECELTSRIGFEHRFEPVTFVLEPDQWIAFTLTGVTITYQGKETHARGLASAGMVFLPIRHTALEVGPTRSTRRHFIEVATWKPARNAQWQLLWRLFEVQRDTLVSLANETVFTISASSPPAPDAFELGTMAELRVTNAGEAEWVLRGNTAERSDVIPTEAERVAAAREASERKARDARVDWNLQQDRYRIPTLQYREPDGCGMATVAASSDDRAEWITVRVETNPKESPPPRRTFDLSRDPASVSVLLHVYERATREPQECTDVGLGDSNRPELWRALAGTLIIEVSSIGSGSNRKSRATIRIEGAEFVSSTGQHVRQTAPIIFTAGFWIFG
jgi:hypothetical protein